MYIYLNLNKIKGGLFCAATPWSFLQLNPNNKLSDIQLYNFLMRFGIEYTPNCMKTPPSIDISIDGI